VDNLLLSTRRGALAEITLNRPAALNALNDEMRAVIISALPEWPRDPDVYALIVRSAAPRAFCAGGDVRELTRLAAQDLERASASLAQEYRMNWGLECFSKPTISLIDGMVMGSGVGLMLYGTHRVAGTGFQFAMPETAVGFFPDVGVGHALSRMPNHLGRYLGLTGRSIGRRAALRLGLITHCIDAGHFAAITNSLEEADPVDPVLDQLHRSTDQEADELADVENLIKDVFAGTTLRTIFDALEKQAAKTGHAAQWCAEALHDLKKRSPTSLHVTFRHLDGCRNLDLRQVLIQDYRLAVKFLSESDFKEGVRAVLIDKDNKPNWQYNSINEVGDEKIENYFRHLGAGELHLPERDEMQKRRA
jgi:enoyl-CoA hydratase/carnithine racemase